MAAAFQGTYFSENKQGALSHYLFLPLSVSLYAISESGNVTLADWQISVPEEVSVSRTYATRCWLEDE